MTNRRPTFSLHTSRANRDCDICGERIPKSNPECPVEYWRAKYWRGCPGASIKVICVLCHELYGFPSDGWNEVSDGLNQVTAIRPHIALQTSSGDDLSPSAIERLRAVTLAAKMRAAIRRGLLMDAIGSFQ